MADTKSVVGEMAAFDGDTPSAIGESYLASLELGRMTDQLEWETSLRGDNEGIGRIPALFMTLAEPSYKWKRLNRLIRKWRGESDTVPGKPAEEKKTDSPLEANSAPAIAERCAALKPGLFLMIDRKIRGNSGYGSVEDDYSTSEWGDGGMTHLHIVLWVKNAPRIDVVAENEKARDASGRGDLLLEHEVVNQMADLFDQYISDVKPSKPDAGEEDLVGVNRPANNAGAEKLPTHCDVGRTTRYIEAVGRRRRG